MAFEVRRGTNISHWLSQSKARGDQRRAWFTAEDVQRIAGWGFDHIRLPIDEEQMWQEDGNRETEAFDLLGNALDWCAEAGLNVIVDLHILRSHYFISEDEPKLFTDPAEAERLAGLWHDLSDFMKARSTENVAYELLNEAMAKEPASWNRVAKVIFDAVRALEPERTIVLGSNRWNQYQTYPELDVPDDDHLLLTFHYYNPMFVTHYRAGWTEFGLYEGPIQYPGKPVPEAGIEEMMRLLPENGPRENQYYDREVMKQHITIPYEIAQKHNAPLYCGEFGIYEKVPLEIRQPWYQDIVSIFDELGIGWGNWDYKGGFGLLSHDGTQETGVRAALGL